MSGDPEITDPRDPYRRPDIVTELDRQLLHWHEPMVQRARDEILALRKLTDGNWVWKQITDTRDDALEEAARVALRWQDTACGEFDRALAIAAAIRALKDKKHNE